jgi:Tol biopolymer transport system component
MTASRLARGVLSAALLAAAAAAAAPASGLAADANLDDRALTRSGKWSDATDAKASNKTLTRAKKKGATLTATTAAKSGGSVVVQVGPARGSISVSVGGKKKTTISTSAKKKSIKSFSFKGTGTVKLTVTKLGAGVWVDAVKLKGVPQPPTGPTGPGGSTPGTAPGGQAPTPAPGGGPTPPSAAPANLGPLAQLNLAGDGTPQDNFGVTTAAISPDHQKIAFWARANNLVLGVADGRSHLYVKTFATGAIIVADRAANGTLSNDNQTSSGTQALTWKPDSTEITFGSGATNLVPDNVGTAAPFLYSKSLEDNSIGWIAVGVTEAAWSPDGSKIAITTTGNYCSAAASGVPCSYGTSDPNVYSWDVASQKFTPISAPQNGQFPAAYPAGAARATWSPDSSRIAFVSPSNALVPGDTNAADDVFIKTLSDRSIQRVSLSSSGAQADGSSDQPAFSPDGSKLAFQSKADNFAVGDNNSASDVFVRDLASGAMSVVSTGEDGAFKLFGSRTPRWSPDGSKLAFASDSLDLIPGFTDNNQIEDVYVRTLGTGKIQLASVRPDGVQGNGASVLFGVLGNSGGWVGNAQLAFLSRATNFSTADGNAFNPDLFIKTLN